MQRLHLLNRPLTESELVRCFERFLHSTDQLLLMGEAVCLLTRPTTPLSQLASENRLLALQTDCRAWRVIPTLSVALFSDQQWVQACATADQVISW